MPRERLDTARRLQQRNWYPQIKDQQVARCGVDYAQSVHDRASHSMADEGQNHFAHRALGDDVRAAKGFVNAGFIFFTLAVLATLIFGRFVCG